MVAQTNFLLVFNETTGTSVTNYGSTTGVYTLQDDPTAPAMAPTTDYVWHPNTGPFKGYLESKTKNSLAMPWLSTAATLPGTTLNALNVAVAFRIRSVDNSMCRLVSSSTNTIDGGAFIYTGAPSGGGDFDLIVRFAHDGSQDVTRTFTGCTFNTDYQVAASCDPSILATVTGRYKLNAAAAVSNTASWTTNNWESQWPYLLRRSDFTRYYGLDGYIYYFAYQRGGTAWSASDLDAINASPSSALPGWPGGGGGTNIAAIASYYRMLANA